MKNSFIIALQRLGSFTPSQLESIEKASLQHVFSKKELLLKAGEICTSFYWIKAGEVYQFEQNDENDEFIIDLHCAGDWVSNVKSFTTRSPSKYYITAFAKCEIYELQIDAIHRLITQSPSLLQLGKIIGESVQRLEWLDQQLSPDEKYKYLLAHKAELLQSFPQHMIASYLKITPETLSRVRKRLIS